MADSKRMQSLIFSKLENDTHYPFKAGLKKHLHLLGCLDQIGYGAPFPKKRMSIAVFNSCIFNATRSDFAIKIDNGKTFNQTRHWHKGREEISFRKKSNQSELPFLAILRKTKDAEKCTKLRAAFQITFYDFGSSSQLAISTAQRMGRIAFILRTLKR